MESTQAWERLRDPEYCSRLTTEGFRALLEQARYPRAVIEESTKRHAWERLSAGETI